MPEIDHHIFLHLNAEHFHKSNIIHNKKYGGEKISEGIPTYIGLDLFKGFLLILVITYHARNINIHEDELSYWILTWTMPLFTAISGYLINEEFIAPEKGAETLLYLATTSNEDLVSGEYYTKSHVAKITKESYDMDMAEELLALIKKYLKKYITETSLIFP